MRFGPLRCGSPTDTRVRCLVSARGRVRRWASWAGAPPLRCDQHAAASLGLKRHGRSRVVHIAAEWAVQEQCAIAYDSAGASPRLSSLQRGEKAQQAINRLRGRLADIGPSVLPYWSRHTARASELRPLAQRIRVASRFLEKVSVARDLACNGRDVTAYRSGAVPLRATALLDLSVSRAGGTLRARPSP